MRKPYSSAVRFSFKSGGPCYATLGIRAFRPGKRNSKAPRFGGALCSCDCALLARLIGRRRRRELLAARLLRQPRGGSPATRMVAHVDLLSYQQREVRDHARCVKLGAP